MPAPDKQVLAYAAGASLAAATLIYVFGPTWPLDSSDSSSKQRKKGVVGLANPANDCFINSILQALAGLEDLRAYLIRRTRVARQRGELTDCGLTVEQKPFLTAALKEILDNLNERPLHKKTISNRPFLLVLERVFRQQISRAQQDAHEFLQVVAETLAEEHNKQKKRVMDNPIRDERTLPGLLECLDSESDSVVITNPAADSGSVEKPLPELPKLMHTELEFGNMPLEGKLKSEIECQRCGFKPKATVSTFVVLTLPVPQKNNTSLAECIDGTLSTEYIDDFQCAKCSLMHSIETLKRKQEESPQEQLEEMISKLENSLETDPEKLPEDVMPPVKNSPRSRIAKRTAMEEYPDIIALHLSRSIYDTYASRKNGARVTFDELIKMGSLLNRISYRLLCVVTHKGGHDSGHYECFRRQIVARAPYSTPSPLPSSPVTPIPSTPSDESSVILVDSASTSLDLASPSTSIETVIFPGSVPTSVFSGSRSTPPSSLLSPGEDGIAAAPTASPTLQVMDQKLKSPSLTQRIKRKRKNDRWWRISDDKIKEARTADVLSMQKEVYLLFYQREKDEDYFSHL